MTTQTLGCVKTRVSDNESVGLTAKVAKCFAKVAKEKPSLAFSEFLRVLCVKANASLLAYRICYSFILKDSDLDSPILGSAGSGFVTCHRFRVAISKGLHQTP